MLYILQQNTRTFSSCFNQVLRIPQICTTSSSKLSTLPSRNCLTDNSGPTYTDTRSSYHSWEPIKNHPYRCQYGELLGSSSVMHQSFRFQVRQAKESRQVVESRQKGGQITTAEKVKQAGKDATYTTVFLIGFGVTGLMFFAIGRELLSSQSPSGVYAKAVKMCKKNDELVSCLGEPIKAKGETNRRGRSRHVNHTEYEKDGVEYMRMRFYVDGPHNNGTAHLEVKKNEGGKWDFRYIFVELEQYPRKTVIIEDNRY